MNDTGCSPIGCLLLILVWALVALAGWLLLWLLHCLGWSVPVPH